MLSSNNHMAVTSSPSNSLCEGSISPSSAHSQPSTRELDSSQHSLRNEISSDDPTDFSLYRVHDSISNLPANIEIHPQNDTLSSTSASHQQFIKRPLNAYMIWTRQERRKILTGEPKKKMNEVSKAMGEKWKKMTDKDKKPYFEMARKFALEHKQALQEHPELTYAPSKKKGPKRGADDKDSKDGPDHPSSNSTPYAVTPDPSPRSTTPRQVVGNAGMQQNPMFVQFQTPFNTGTMQIAQVLGVRPPVASAVPTPNSYGIPLATPPTTPISHSMFMQPQQQTPNFAQPQVQTPQRLIQQPGIMNQLPASQVVNRNTTPGQMLDLYYTSLCQPAFPTISESPVNTLSMYPPQYFLDQYNQHFTHHPNSNGSGAAPHY